jgi:hypothetical protein
MTFGVVASSAYITISSVNINDASGRIKTAAMSLSSWNAVNYSSITATGAHGFYLSDSTMTTISFSTAQINSANFIALYLINAASNTVQNSLLRNVSLGSAGRLASSSQFNTIILSTFAANRGGFTALELDNASSNTITRTHIRGGVGTGMALLNASNFNGIYQSTITEGGGSSGALVVTQSSWNVILDSFLLGNAATHVAFFSDSNYNSIIRSTVSAVNGTGQGLILSQVSSHTITQSYLSEYTQVGNSTGTTISLSTLVANGGLTALEVTGGVNLTLTSTTLLNTSAGLGR